MTDIPEDAILVTADAVDLYPSIPHRAGLEAFKITLDLTENKFISTDDKVKMAEFILKNNYFQFNGKLKQQISGTAIGSKFAPTYACVFMDQIETDFLRAQKNVPFVWFRYIDDVFLLWTHGENKLKSLMEKLNQFYPNLSFTYESSKNKIAFLDCKVNLFENKLNTELYVKPTDTHISTWVTSPHILSTLKSQKYTFKL